MNLHVGEEFLEAVHSRGVIRGLTHAFYRYPARFSPLFARAAIKAFTKPGDIVFDPFVGGGTTLVEASVLGRRGIGTDINFLSVFVSRVKTTIYSEADYLEVRAWAEELNSHWSLRNRPLRAAKWANLGYQRNINGKWTWPLRKALEIALAHLTALRTPKQKRFARCLLLKTAQWALDCRTHIPSAEQFRVQFFENLEEMISGAREYADAVKAATLSCRGQQAVRPLCLRRSIVGIETDGNLRKHSPPALILTSPPYPGVHVLYHRWQVQGRKETPAAFWIANSVDGNGASFYTFGDRKRRDLATFYENLRAAFGSLARIADRNTLVVQLVAFSDPTWQLPRYLEVIQQAGFTEATIPEVGNSCDARLWRCVPNRKWYADQRGAIPTSKEVVLFHRLA